MSERVVQVAMVQMAVVGGDKQRNVAHACELIAEAAEHGADVVLLPECCDLGWTHPTAVSEAESVPDGSVCVALAESARKHQVFVCAGLTERDQDKVFNAAVLIDDTGRVCSKHRKLNELAIAHDLYAQGDRLQVVETSIGTIGVMICADAFAHAHTVTRSLGYMGADMILSPSSWAVPPDHDPVKQPYGNEWRQAYGPVAKDFSLPIVGVSNVGPVTGGPWQDWNCIGCSLAVGADGSELVQGPYGVGAETILYVELALTARPTRGNGWAQHLS